MRLPTPSPECTNRERGGTQSTVGSTSTSASDSPSACPCGLSVPLLARPPSCSSPRGRWRRDPNAHVNLGVLSAHLTSPPNYDEAELRYYKVRHPAYCSADHLAAPQSTADGGGSASVSPSLPPSLHAHTTPQGAAPAAPLTHLTPSRTSPRPPQPPTLSHGRRCGLTPSTTREPSVGQLTDSDWGEAPQATA